MLRCCCACTVCRPTSAGSLGWLSVWRATVRSWPSTSAAVAVARSRRPGSCGLDNHARDILDVATALGVDDFDIAGWSLGALISMRVALDNGDRLRSVTLMA